MVLMPSNINYESLVFLVLKIIRANLNYFVYDIRTLYNTHGDPCHSFQLLPSYFYMLEKENLGTVTKLLMDEKNKFEYAFMSFGPSITGFKECCKPLIVIYGHT